jgi:tetratricopeptide (TPR) repeat protein
MNPQLELMLQQAVQAFQNGNFDAADLSLKRVLQIDSKNLPALHILGLIKASQSKYKEAAEYLARAARIHPNDASIQFNLAKALADSGNDKESLAHHKKAVALAPDNPEAWLNYGKSVSKLGRHEDALVLYENALSLKPDYAEAAINKGAALKELHRYDEAIVLAERALIINPNLVEAWSNIGAALKELKRFDEAVTHYDKALSLRPDYVDGWFNKGVVLQELKQYDEAITHYDKALSLKPDYVEGLTNKGVVLLELKQYDEAITHYDKALSLKPDYVDGWSNKGLVLHELKQYDEAITHYDKALSLDPDYAEGWSNKAMLNLFLKKYQAGWKDYDWRLKTKDFQLKMAIEGLLSWDGSCCNHLLIRSEQGVGDIIFYASILGIAKNRVGKITISIDVRLIPILSRSFPELRFVDERLPLDASHYDAQIPLGSLPVLMNMKPDMVGRKVPYLLDNDEITKTLKDKLYLKKQLRCGVAWKSNNQKLGGNKSILLSDLNNIFQVDGYEFINLQYGDTQEEITDLEKNYGAKLIAIEGIDLFKDIDGLLSIIQTCDLILS